MTNHVKNLESDISYDKDRKLVIEYVKKILLFGTVNM